MLRSLNFRLFRVSCEEGFTIEALSSQSSKNFLIKKLITPRPPRLGGAISDPRFTGKPQDLNFQTYSCGE